MNDLNTLHTILMAEVSRLRLAIRNLGPEVRTALAEPLNSLEGQIRRIKTGEEKPQKNIFSVGRHRANKTQAANRPTLADAISRN